MTINDRSVSNLRNEKIVSIRKIGQKFGFWDHGHGYPLHCRSIFDDVELEGKRILEIGCGNGLLSIWASINGASQVVGLEPLEDGSGSFDSSRTYKEFKEMVAAAELLDIEMHPLRIQDFAGQDNYFDVVLLMDSVNHIDEEACIQLRASAEAREVYFKVFKQINRLMKKEGKIILTDCANRNFFADLGIVNPMAKSIEWFKHQQPVFWRDLLFQCGFGEPKIIWPSGRLLRYLRIGSRGRFLSYMIDSSFRLEMTRMETVKSD